MKTKWFLLFCLLFSVHFCFCQYPDVLNSYEGGIWSLYKEFSLTNGEKIYRTDQYTCVPWIDTIIGGKTYNQVIWRKDCDKRNERFADYVLREEDSRLYAYDYLGQKEHIIMDFSLQVGDILETDWIDKTEDVKSPVFFVQEVGDTLMTSWDNVHYLKVYDTVYHKTDLWISRIGSQTYGIAWNKYRNLSTDTLETLLCVNDLYKNPAYNSCYLSSYTAGEWDVTGLGKLEFITHPFNGYPLPDCCYEAMALKTDSTSYLINYNSCLVIDGSPLLFEGEKFVAGDSVEAIGTATIFYDLGGEKYTEMKLYSIRKLGSAGMREGTHKNQYRITYSPIEDMVVFDENLAGLVDMVEIMNIQGTVILRVVAPVSGRVAVNMLSNGAYLYRLFRKGKPLQSGKIVIRH